MFKNKDITAKTNRFWYRVIKIDDTINSDFFTARRYASVVYAVVVCPAVCHKPGLYRNDWIYIAGFFGTGASFDIS